MGEDLVTMERVDDPAAIARVRAREERVERNDEWLRAHWPDILPRARGRCLAVAGQEAFIADTEEEARALARAAHPEDDGLLCQSVSRYQRLTDNLLTIHLMDDPAVVARSRAQDQRFQRNLDW